MADKEFESDDPMELVGLLMQANEKDIEEMGLTFVEEYVRMRWPREEIEAVFANPHYRGPHTVYRVKGPAFIAGLIDLVTGVTPTAAQPTGCASDSSDDTGSATRPQQVRSQQEG